VVDLDLFALELAGLQIAQLLLRAAHPRGVIVAAGARAPVNIENIDLLTLSSAASSGEASCPLRVLATTVRARERLSSSVRCTAASLSALPIAALCTIRSTSTAAARSMVANTLDSSGSIALSALWIAVATGRLKSAL